MRASEKTVSPSRAIGWRTARTVWHEAQSTALSKASRMVATRLAWEARQPVRSRKNSVQINIVP